MTKKKKAAVAAGPGEQEKDETSTQPATGSTFTAASGKFFAVANDDYPEPEDFAEEFTVDVVTALAGDLLEVLAIHEDWGYGRRFKAKDGVQNEGVFRLEWVRGMKQVMEGGKRKPVELDIRSAEYGFREPRASETAAKLQSKRHRKRMEEAADVWVRLEAEAADAEKREAAEARIAKTAAQLEREDEQMQAKKRREDERRQAILQEVQRRKAEAEAARRRAAAEEEERREAEEHERREREAEAELARRRALEAELAEERRREQELEVAEAKRRAAKVEERRRERAEEERRRRSEERERAAEVSRTTQPKSSSLHSSTASPNSLLVAPRRDASTQADDTRRRRRRGREDSDADDSAPDETPRALPEKKTSNRKLKARREPRGLPDEWEKVREEMASKTSDLNALEEKVNRSLGKADGSGALDCELRGRIQSGRGLRIAKEMVSEAERRADEVSELKHRVFQAMLNLKRDSSMEKRLKQQVFQAMFDVKRSSEEVADKGHEMQVKNLMRMAFKGMRDSRRARGECDSPPSDSLCSPCSQGHCSLGDESMDSPEVPSGKDSLELIAEQLVEQLQNKANSIKEQIRKGLLRAHRNGELLELKVELDELVDSVTDIGDHLVDSVDSPPGLEISSRHSSDSPDSTAMTLSGGRGRGSVGRLGTASRRESRAKRWAEYTSGESEFEYNMREFYSDAETRRGQTTNLRADATEFVPRMALAPPLPGGGSAIEDVD